MNPGDLQQSPLSADICGPALLPYAEAAGEDADDAKLPHPPQKVQVLSAQVRSLLDLEVFEANQGPR